MKKLLPIFKRRPSWLLMMCVLAVTSGFGQSQTGSVSGTVKDETGAALPGVNILIKGSAKGTTTDDQGRFTLVASPAETMIITFIGYETKEVVIGNQTNFDVRLVLNVEALSEVVVTGYQTQKRSDLTGAVASVNLDQSKDIPGGSVMQS